MTIPNEYHFVFGLGRDKPFLLVHYLAIASCHKVNRPSRINFYYKYEPSGPWWERAKRFLNLVPIEPPREIFGNALLRPEHVADVLRLRILLERGGIYLDVDVLSLRPFAPLQEFDAVLGEEKGVGLCNAVILAKPGARFLQLWLDAYRTFNPDGWVEHSVLIPRQLATGNPDLVHVVGHRNFFWPMYWRDQLRAFLLHPGSDYCRESLCVHLWQSQTWTFLRRLTPEYLLSVDSEFCTLFRPYIQPGWLLESQGAPSGARHNSIQSAKERLQSPAKMRTAVGALSSESREAVTLCDLLRIDGPDAAALLGCSEETLASHLQRGRAAMSRRESGGPVASGPNSPSSTACGSCPPMKWNR